jgi:hypothetical protein
MYQTGPESLPAAHLQTETAALRSVTAFTPVPGTTQVLVTIQSGRKMKLAIQYYEYVEFCIPASHAPGLHYISSYFLR